MKNLFNSKKAGIGDFSLSLVPLIMYVILIIGVTLFLISSTYQIIPSSRQVDATVFARSLYFNEHITHYDSVLNRYYFGTLKSDIFSQDCTTGLCPSELTSQLSSHYEIPDDIKHLSARLTVTQVGSDNQQKTTFYVHEDFFHEKKTYVDAGWTEGSGGYELFTFFYFVTIGPAKIPAQLRIEVIIEHE